MIGENDLALPAKMMDLHKVKSKLIANNIANASIPGYRKLDVSFDAEFARALQSGDTAEVKNAQMTFDRAATPGVNAEMEVVQMTKSEGAFNTFAEIASFNLRMLRAAISSK